MTTATLVAPSSFHLPKLTPDLLDKRKEAFERVADELLSQSWRDEIVHRENIRVKKAGDKPTLVISDANDYWDGNRREYPIDWQGKFIDQACSEYGINSKFFRKLWEHGEHDLALTNLNTLISRPFVDKEDSKSLRMVRVLDGQAEAYVSNAFLRLDNGRFVDWMRNQMNTSNLIPVHYTAKHGNVVVRAVIPIARTIMTMPKVDDHFYGVTFTNSMVGDGLVEAMSWLYRFFCANGASRAIGEGEGYRRRHIGRRHKFLGEIGSSDRENDTIEAILDRAATKVLNMTDPTIIDADFEIVRTAASIIDSRNVIARLTTEERIEAASKACARFFELTREQGQEILMNWLREPDGQDGTEFTLFGLSNAITYAANGASEEKAIELMQVGGESLDWSFKKFDNFTKLLEDAIR